jgi:hypothetical protein
LLHTFARSSTRNGLKAVRAHMDAHTAEVTAYDKGKRDAMLVSVRRVQRAERTPSAAPSFSPLSPDLALPVLSAAASLALAPREL